MAHSLSRGLYSLRAIAATLLVVLALMIDMTSAARSAGCGKSPISSGTKSMTVNGKNRQYIVRVPNNYNPNTAYKLIAGLHWLGGTAQDVATGQTVQRDVWVRISQWLLTSSWKRLSVNSGARTTMVCAAWPTKAPSSSLLRA